jgi:hypothetical protein
MEYFVHMNTVVDKTVKHTGTVTTTTEHDHNIVIAISDLLCSTAIQFLYGFLWLHSPIQRFKQRVIEIPLYLVSTYQYLNVSDIRDSTLQVTKTNESSLMIDGGFLIGINNFIHLQMKVSKNISLFSEFNFGLMYAQLGGIFDEKITLSGSDPILNSLEKKYSKLFVSAPQFQFGVTYHLF